MGISVMFHGHSTTGRISLALGSASCTKLAYDELQTNIKLIRPGPSMKDLQASAWLVPEEFREQAYPCVIHGVGMCGEYSQVKP
ncbi:hypothetical protein BQ8482_850009 [Mesorhizobium delmotii]|uniref:Uncharacterized protein n=1 Tax=Mesorhizobium delmotii TaxID=1631247 RepID=A0A2P9AWX4_9HYPH|nr:hypothetical protein BQ8482_850009 [Mesorhizobium delmotii]